MASGKAWDPGRAPWDPGTGTMGPEHGHHETRARARWDPGTGTMGPGHGHHGTRARAPWDPGTGTVGPGHGHDGTRARAPWDPGTGTMGPGHGHHGTRAWAPWDPGTGTMGPGNGHHLLILHVDTSVRESMIKCRWAPGLKSIIYIRPEMGNPRPAARVTFSNGPQFYFATVMLKRLVNVFGQNTGYIRVTRRSPTRR